MVLAQIDIIVNEYQIDVRFVVALAINEWDLPSSIGFFACLYDRDY